MKLTISIELSETESLAPCETAGDTQNALWHTVEDLDRGLSEANSRIDALETLLASGQARPPEPTFDSDADDADL